MRIHSLELENIKSYEHLKIDFTDGVNGIVGHNGAGKSTILEAIGFALFDSLDYTQASFLRQSAGEGSIVVTFESANDRRTYQVVRKLGTGAGQEVHDVELGTALCSGAADVPRFLRLHMGVAPETEMAQLFKDAVGVPQGTLTAAFSIGHAFRKRIFDPLLRVDEYQTAFQKLLDTKNLLARRISDLEIEIARMQGVLEQLPTLRERARTTAAALAATIEDLARNRTALHAAEAERARFEGQRAALQQAEQERDAARTGLAAVQAQLDGARALLADSEQAHRIVIRDQPGHDLYTEAQAARTALDARLHQRQQLEVERAQASARSSVASDRARRAAAELEEARRAERRLVELEPQVQVQKKLETQRGELYARAAELDAARKHLAQVTTRLEQESPRLADMQRLARELPPIDALIVAAEATLLSLRADQEALNQQTVEVRARGMHYKERDDEVAAKLSGEEVCPLCEQPLTPGHLDHLRERNEAERALLREQMRALMQKSNELQTLLNETEARKNTAQTQRSKLPNPDVVAQLEQYVHSLERDQSDAEVRVRTRADAAATLQQVEKELAQLGNPRHAYDLTATLAAKSGALQQEVERAEQEAAEAARTAAGLDEALRAYVTLDAQIHANTEELARTLDAYQSVLANRQTAALRETRAAQVAVGQVAADQARTRLDAAEEAVASAAALFDAAAYLAASSDEARLRGVVGGLARQQELLAAERAKLHDEIETMVAQELVLTGARRRHSHLKTQESVLDKMRKVIRDAGPHMTKALIRRTSEQAAQIYGELTGDFTRRLHWNEEYGITLEVDGRERDFKNLSGGEQMVAALSVRLALLREMSTIDIAFFDEPTAHLDGQRREALASQILSIKGFRQIFVISHDDTFERATHNLIHVERVDGISRLVAA